MNIKQTAWISILVISSMSLFGVEPVNAKNAEIDTSKTTQSTNIAQVPNLATPIYGSWKLTHSIGGIVHESVLKMNGSSGTMTTRFFNAQSGKTEAVEQTMYLKPHPRGILIWGYNPVYSGTSIKHPIYHPDNFFFSIPPDGPAIFLNCDDGKQCSYVDVEVVNK
jgi:hypothetical protein